MDDAPAALARLLAEAGAAERARLIATHAGALDAALGRALKQRYDSWEASDPPRALAASDALDAVAAASTDAELQALAEWTGGMAALDRGDLPRALARLEAADSAFRALGDDLTAARTLVARLVVLAILGRADEAEAVGLRARGAFLARGALLDAGKIEQNLGALAGRRERHAESERWFRLARERYLALGDERQLAQVDNNLATALKWQLRLAEAATVYAEARARADAGGQSVTVAEIDCNLAILAIFGGRYDEALASFEAARRRYEALGLAPRALLTEQELADAWLELNLVPEAVASYTRLVPQLRALGAQADLARALAHLGRGLLALGRSTEAAAPLAEARDLYAREGNRAGAALVELAEAERALVASDPAAALAATERALPALETDGAQRRLLQARWLRGDALRQLGDPAARQALESTLAEARARNLPEVARACHTSLGMLAAAGGDRAEARAQLGAAIEAVEALRAPLPSEELRTAFIASRLAPYQMLARLLLDDGSPDAVVEAFRTLERARSRTLLDLLGGALERSPRPASGDAADEIARRLAALRAELTWLYAQLDRAAEDGETRGSDGTLGAIAREREREIGDLTRRLAAGARGAAGSPDGAPDIATLQAALAADQALVAYAMPASELVAFVVTREGVEVVRGLAFGDDVTSAVGQVRFQLDGLRHGAARLARHLPQLETRIRIHLAALYDLLLRPLEPLVEGRRLILVPHGPLHELPFQALHDGTRYLIERHELSMAPSASVLLHCLARPRRPLRRALLLGVPDERAPRARDELQRLRARFPHARALLDADATSEALRRHAPDADLLHLACHGTFRRDNPRFSALRLADGRLTASDAAQLPLACELATLSACETGVAGVLPGDEPLGLARAFLAAGAASLVVSLWTVDDAVTAELMDAFYARLQAGDAVAAALRGAQLTLLRERPHPWWWAAFSVVGRP